MTDITNDFPDWGESGEYPPDGFFYEGGDQVNEKHLDALWNGLGVQIAEFIAAIERRVADLDGDVILDGGLRVSTTASTREIEVSLSDAGAFIDGQYTGSAGNTTATLSTNNTGSTRTDSVFVDEAGQVGVDESTTSVADDKHKLAEVDVATDDTISAVRNTGRRVTRSFAAPVDDPHQVPGGFQRGDLWYDSDAGRLRVRDGGAWRSLLSETDGLTVTAGDGLKNGGTTSLDGGGSLTLDIEPADFAGDGLDDDGSDDLVVDPSDFAGGGLFESGSDLAVDAGNQLSINNGTLDVNEGPGSGLDADSVDGQDAQSLEPNIGGTTTRDLADSNTTLTNSTGSPIMVQVGIESDGFTRLKCFVDGNLAETSNARADNLAEGFAAASFLVPNGSSYEVNFASTSASILSIDWVEYEIS